MDKVAIYITAYNAENTLSAMIESILNQTYKNFDIYISDNGSSDGTFEIIKEYCIKYENIFCYRRKKNFAGSFMYSIYCLMSKCDLDFTVFYKYDAEGNVILFTPKWAEWACFVDSDDTIQPTYLEDMLSFAKENELDMVMCGWDFVRPDRTDHRIPEKNEIIFKEEFSSRLTYYDKFMGPVWNKMFRLDSLMKDIDYYENKFSKLFKDGVYFYGADTAFNYLYLGNKLEKFGLISESLYNYNISDESVSRKRFHPMRIIADRRMAEVRFDYLLELGEEISDENREFILNIYHKSTDATIELLKNDNRFELKEKMRYMHEIFDYYLFHEEFERKERKYL